MSEENKTQGYCPLCMQNVEHTRKFSSIFSRLLDIMTLGLTKFFRIGPYYCFQCENKTLFLRPVRWNAPTFNSTTSAVNFADPRNDRRKTQPSQSLDETVGLEANFEPAGNFLKSERSLLMQDRRSRNYTQKFREGTVQKILAGTALLHEIKQDLDVTETDLIGWIADVMNRKEQRIEELEKTLEAVQAHLPIKIAPLLNAKSGRDGIVEGQVADP